jgi:hypothetical protein
MDPQTLAMRITAEYLDLNIRAHRAMPDYGRNGSRWADQVRALMARSDSATALDYGCGKGALAASLPGVAVAEYDPAIPGKDAEPAAADLVVCTDVLEHVEPDCLPAVLDHIDRLATKALLINVALVTGRRRLPDGTPAHRLVRDAEFWQHQLQRFGEWQPIPTRPDAWAATCIRAT